MQKQSTSTFKCPVNLLRSFFFALCPIHPLTMWILISTPITTIIEFSGRTHLFITSNLTYNKVQAHFFCVLHFSTIVQSSIRFWHESGETMINFWCVNFSKDALLKVDLRWERAEMIRIGLALFNRCKYLHVAKKEVLVDLIHCQHLWLIRIWHSICNGIQIYKCVGENILYSTFRPHSSLQFYAVSMPFLALSTRSMLTLTEGYQCLYVSVPLVDGKCKRCIVKQTLMAH